jgi:hypothetical protein
MIPGGQIRYREIVNLSLKTLFVCVFGEGVYKNSHRINIKKKEKKKKKEGPGWFKTFIYDEDIHQLMHKIQIIFKRSN